MRPGSSVRWARRLGLAALMGLGTTVTAAAAPRAAPMRQASATRGDVTEHDIAVANEKIRQAYGSLVSMWTDEFARMGERFVAPRIVRYRGAVMTSCGVMDGNNANYCGNRNTIFFDEVFVARQAKAAAEELGTDGDMVAVGIIAHEMGHAVAAQLGDVSDIPYENEAIADCLAGAFAQHAKRNGELEKGDLEEAFFGMAAAGDPAVQLTGNRRLDSRRVRFASLMGHGSRDQRMTNFRTGLEGGARACLE